MKTYRYLILGGGMVAGYAAKEFVAQSLKPGELGIISADTALPYERPPLSKGFLAGKEDSAGIVINDEAFYHEHGIDVRLNTTVEYVDLQARQIRTQPGDSVGFAKLLIATGARVRRLDVPGTHMNGLYYLRTLDDARQIRDRSKQAQRAVVIGGGFIGMEVAAVLAEQQVTTTLVFPDEQVWQRMFTPRMSTFFQRYYEARGVTIMPNTKITAVLGTHHVTGVELDSGRQVPADIVVAGIGVEPVTNILEGTGIRLDNGIVVNEYLETSVRNVYAAGDVAKYHDVLYDTLRRVEHWDNAVEQARHVVRVMLGDRKPFVHVPYFFSDVFDLSYEFWGDTADADRVVCRGDVDSSAFSVWWLKNQRLIAAFVLNRPEAERELAPRWIAERQTVSPERLEDESRALG